MNGIVRIADCPFCGVGTIYVARQKKHRHRHYFVCCDECNTQWDNPKDFFDNAQGICDKYCDTDSMPAFDLVTIEEAKKIGWVEYLYIMREPRSLWEHIASGKKVEDLPTCSDPLPPLDLEIEAELKEKNRNKQ